MAADIRTLMDRLGIARAAIVGHDRGARVATRFAKDHPDRISRLAVLDNVPTLTIFERMDVRIARSHWVFIFNQVPDLPEALIAGREEIWLRFNLQGWTYDPELLTPEDLDAYTRAYRKPDAVRDAPSDYRAGREDVEQDRQDRGIRIACPVLALWGQDFELIGRMFDVEAIWREMASDLRAVSIPQCGHLPHEERPAMVNAALLDFLDSWAG
jgi:pimeloyl-ACP methyl ester carboxylesterase